MKMLSACIIINFGNENVVTLKCSLRIVEKHCNNKSHLFSSCLSIINAHSAVKPPSLSHFVLFKKAT